MIINTGSREEKCQQGKKLSCVDEDQSVARCERACNLGGEGRRGGENSKLGRRHVRGNVKPGSTHISQTLPISAKNKYRKRGSVLLLVCLIFFNRPSGRALFVRKNFKLARVENTKNFFRMRLPSPRALREFLLGTMILSPSEKKTFEFEHKRLERESSLRG